LANHHSQLLEGLDFRVVFDSLTVLLISAARPTRHG